MCESRPIPKYSKELETAVQDEARRQEIDAAKKRAAAQHVDYETFAALVSMAHIKPLDRNRKREVVPKSPAMPPWSFDASGTIEISSGDNGCFEVSPKQEVVFQHANGHSSGEMASTSSQERPWSPKRNDSVAMSDTLELPSFRTVDTFKREWRRASPCLQKKLCILHGIPPRELPNIFKVEIPPSILADIITVLSFWRSSSPPAQENNTPFIDSEDQTRGIGLTNVFDATFVFHILKALSECGRFSLSLKLVGEKVRSLAISLLHLVEECLRKENACETGSEGIMPYAEIGRSSQDLELEKSLQGIRMGLELVGSDDVKLLTIIYSA